MRGYWLSPFFLHVKNPNEVEVHKNKQQHDNNTKDSANLTE